ncbi:MAG: pantoate--beta-alanine ligase [Elusimicrobia bacterium]|nr:MAG: pantoate--beta-alanine ligase [Elusimicrobiota bacterium]
MRVIRKNSIMQKVADRLREEGKSIGFVPTLGALHQGHLSLMERARRENDILIISIFVNPTQFGPGEDYRRYPRPFGKDRSLARREGVDIIFYPSVSEMYGKEYSTYVEVEKFSKRLCGLFRPGHFRGVTSVVCKLFNIVKPRVAYFGQKDYQQLRIIKRMVEDLNMEVGIRECAIVREPDGLAISSRNSYLSSQEREEALSLYRALKCAKSLIKVGSSISDVVSEMEKIIQRESHAKIDYIEIVDPLTLEDVKTIRPGKKVLVALAVWIGNTRLIDNMLVRRM